MSNRVIRNLIVTAMAAGVMAFTLFPVQGLCEEPADNVGDHDLVMSYIESDNAPVLMNTTAYTYGTVCSHGARARQGIAAIAPEWYGSAVVLYEAVEGEDGYEVGDFICILEGLDTGYGKSTGDGVPSRVREDKDSRGTIETGKTIDVFCESEADAMEWMERTGGKVMCQIIREARG